MAHGNFIQCPTDALKWPYRSQLILTEICRSEADIICLEEVDHFYDFFEPQLASLGFEGLFVSKNDSPCLEYQPNNGPDGCAVFFRSSKFLCIEKKELRLKNEHQGLSNQVALLIRLEIKDPSATKDVPSKVCVGVTHLKAKRDFSVLRAAQGEHLLAEMASFAKNEHVIVCGDFNAPPEEPVYQSFTKNKACHCVALASTYAGSEHHENKEPKFTSWKIRANGEAKYTIDYIWISKDKMCVNSVWKLPTEEEIGINALPCKCYPSDHLALCCSVTLL